MIVAELIKNFYFRFLLAIICLFLTGTLAFGRAFSLLHVPFRFPLFITEAVLLLCLPSLFMKRKIFLEFPMNFLILTLFYFLFSFTCFMKGIMERNFFVFRDITLFGYILFMPVICFLFSSQKRLKMFVILVLIANILAIILGRFFVLKIYPNAFFYDFLITMKAFSFGLNYGIAIGFLLPLLIQSSKIMHKFIISFLIAVNLYMIIICAERTLWLGIIILFSFMVFTFRLRLVKALAYLVPVFLIVFMSLSFIDSQTFGLKDSKVILIKAKTMLNFQRIMKFYQSALIDVNQRNKVIHTGNNGIAKINCTKSSDIKDTSAKSTASIKDTSAKSTASIKDTSAKSTGIKAANTENIKDCCSSSMNITPSYSPLISKIKNTDEIEHWGNIYWRFSIWKQAIDFGMKAPFFGRGLGTQPDYLVWQYNLAFVNVPKKSYFNSNLTPAHNYLVTIFYKMGLLGLVLFLSINISVFYFALGYYKKCRLEFTKFILSAGLGSFVFWHALALFFDIIDSPYTSIFLWVWIGFIFAAIKYDKLRE